jgi:predicted PurR-regulated permease PerM
MALAILFAPAHCRVEAKVSNPNLAATISVLAIGLIAVAPAIFLSERLFAEAAQGTVTLQEKLVSGEWRRLAGGHVVLAKLVQLIDQLNLPAIIGNVAAWLTATSASLVREWVLQLTTAVLTFYFLFYFLRDRKLAVDWLLDISPLSEVEMSRLFERLAATVQATLYDTVAVAAVQGTRWADSFRTVRSSSGALGADHNGIFLGNLANTSHRARTMP